MRRVVGYTLAWSMLGCSPTSAFPSADAGSQPTAVDAAWEEADATVAGTDDDASVPVGDARVGPQSLAYSLEEQDLLFGQDAVRDALLAHSERVPSSFAQVEALFGIGRQCPLPMQGIFVIEEPQTRVGGTFVATAAEVPRIVFTGCSDDPIARISIFAVLVSGTSSVGDALAPNPIELMALDRVTGLYNFYDVTPGETPGHSGTLRRIVQLSDGAVQDRTRRADRPLETTAANENHCFSCHVSGAPIMNELARPWAHWVSEVSPRTRGTYAGLTGDLTRRASRAYELEQSMRLALDRHAAGPPRSEGQGWVKATASTDGGLRRILRSLLCSTELNYEARPLSLFVDAEAVAGTTLVPPGIPANLRIPSVNPTRSEHDRAVERALIGLDVLDSRTALAVRLIDDRDDAFSERRCALVDEVMVDGEPSLRALDARLRRVLGAPAVLAAIPDERARQYVSALVSREPASVLAARREAYVTEAERRVRALAASLYEPQGASEFETGAWRRVAGARALFPRSAAPLPFFGDQTFPLK